MIEQPPPWPLPAVPWQRRQAMLAVIQAALQDQGVQCRCAAVGAETYCAVLPHQLHGVHAALLALGKECPGRLHVWLSKGSEYERVAGPEKLALQQILDADSVTVAYPYNHGTYHIGRSGGIEILPIEHRGTLYLARRRRAQKVDWTLDFANDAAQTERPIRSAARLRAPPEEDEPVDVVYTWVNPADSKWQAARAAWASQQDTELASSANEERYADREELRYSLRSLWLYAPFVRRVFLVTQGHLPIWLNVHNDKINVVRHIDIFPDSSDLPTFNSHAIEACLHRIPGLAERFVYFNDDVFLGQEVTPSTFYTKGGLIKSRFSPSALAPSRTPPPDAIPTDWAAFNANQLIERDFNLRFDRKLKHVPMAMKRSLLQEIEERYAREVRKTRAARFRSSSDLALPSMFAHFYGVASGKAVEWDAPGEGYGYADTGRQDFASALRFIQATQPMFFCLNATRHTDIDAPAQAAMLKAFLEDRYPTTSPFELDSPAASTKAVTSVSTPTTALSNASEPLSRNTPAASPARSQQGASVHEKG